MKNVLLSLAVTLFFINACTHKSSDTNKEFDAFKNRFMDAYWLVNPTAATSLGYHYYDSLLPAYDAKQREIEKQFSINYLDSIHHFGDAQLNDLNKIDKQMMENALLSMQFYADTFKAWQWDPSSYNVAGAFADIVNARNLDSVSKINFIIARLKQVKAYYETAKANIQSPTLVHTQLAIDQSEGTLSYLENDLKAFCANSSQAAMAQELIKQSVLAVNDYKSFLTNLKNEHPRDFKIGKDLYERKFYFDIQAASTAEQIYHKALARKSVLHQDMFALTQKMWSKYFTENIPSDSLKAVRMMIDKVSLKHAHRDSFMQEIEKQIPELTAFVKEKNLLFLDPSKPLKVRRTPAYMDGVAGASINAPGPYDKDAETYYNVSTLEKKTPEQAESYLREYNHYVLQILNIHEAIPGHYAQLVYANKAPSIIKTIFGNNAMIEGWAVYGEKMMLENGYHQSDEMQLMYDKWHLRSVCNTILDYSVHVLGWDENVALNLLMNEAFQQEAEARGKWRRVSVSQVQLCCYFTGFSEIYELREDMKKKPDFNLKKFHEQFLSYGSAPVKNIRQMMMK